MDMQAIQGARTLQLIDFDHESNLDAGIYELFKASGCHLTVASAAELSSISISLIPLLLAYISSVAMCLLHGSALSGPAHNGLPTDFQMEPI